MKFSSIQNMEICQFDVCLLPITGLKIVFHDSRHLLISRTSKMGKVFFDVINAGIKALRKTGEIRRRLEQTGLININAKDWLVIND